MKIIIITFFLLLSGLSESKMSRHDKKMDAFLEKSWNELLALNPQNASYHGDKSKAHLLTPTHSEYHEQRRATMAGILENLESIKRSKLSEQHKINYDMFKQQMESQIADIGFKEYQMPINSEDSFHVRLAFISRNMSFKTLEDYQNYVKKLTQIPKAMTEGMDNLRQGLKEGRTQPQAILKHYPDFIQKYIVEDPKQSAFYAPLTAKPKHIDQSDMNQLQSEAVEIISNQIYPKYREFKSFMQEQYLPNARTDIGATTLPKGKEYYQQQIKEYTTLDLTAEEIHKIGWDEVKRIRKEMEQIISDLKFEGSFSDFLNFLRTDPQFYAKTPEELLKQARDISKRMDGKLPELFTKLPRQPYAVNPVPDSIAPNYTTGRYVSAPLDSTRPGQYWVNTYALEKRPLYNLEALSFHEAVPGHHLQISLNAELEHLPKFRRYNYISAFGEGWGLYSEKLAKEVGFYQDPYSDFGRLTYEMWRAMRLVVDTGMHAMGMSRDEAIKLMEENTALSKHNVRTEIDRYIGWPAQALSYKLGEIKIWELRRKAEKELGVKFDIRTFHDAILSQGAVPLGVLEGIIENYIKSNK